MGLVYALTEIANITGDGGSFSMPFLVGAAATDTVIPANEFEKIGVSRESKHSYELADGSVVSYDTGYAFVRLKKAAAITLYFISTSLFSCTPQ